MTDSKKLQWGILGAADIAQKNWHSIAASGNGRLVAVASRRAEKAQAFIADCQASVPVPEPVDAVGGYEALLERADVDAVYIPLPTGLRKEWVIRAAESGRHVMVEKPCAIHADDLKEMLAVCSESGVQFMDGVMFMHNQRLQDMSQAIHGEQQLGELRRICSQFSFCADDDWHQSNIRTSSGLEPAGCLGDLGWYTIRMSLWAMQYEMPETVSGRILFGGSGKDDVPLEFEGSMTFRNGVNATFYNSFRTCHQQLFHVSGSKGYLTIPDFVLPFFDSRTRWETAAHEFTVDGCRFHMENRTRVRAVDEYSNNHPTAQEAALFRKFADCVLTGGIDTFWPEVALKTQLVMDAALKSARQGGVSTAPDPTT